MQFIRIEDVNALYRKGLAASEERNDMYRKAVVKMRNFQRMKSDAENLLKKQLQANRALLHHILFTENISFRNH